MLMQARIWFTSAELAEMKLAGLSSVKRKINQLAERDGWGLRTDDRGAPLARRRAGKGGGYEYHAALLPAASRVDLARRGLTSGPGCFGDVDAGGEGVGNETTEAASAWHWLARQSAEVRTEAERRATILARMDLFEATGMTRTAAISMTAEETGQSTSTLWTWLRLVDGVPPADRLPQLAPRRQGGGKEQEIDVAIWQALCSDYLRLSKPSWTTCIRRTAEPMAKAMGVTLPHHRTLWRKFEREVPPQTVVLRRKGDDALRQMLPPQQRTVAELHALELVNIDGHRCDVFVKTPDGRKIRPTLIAIQDVYSRKFLAWRYAETEDMVTARLVFADLFANWGIPKGVLTDNGRAFASKWLTGGAKTRFRFKIRDEDPTGLLTSLGITIHWAKPYRGQSKPIERGFRDLCDAVAKHPAFDGAYTGNSPMAKPEEYDTKAVDWATFIKVWDAGMHAHNRQTGRRTEMGQGRRSFDEVFAESYARSAIGKASDEQLRMALLAADQVRADRRTGAITLAGNQYWSEALTDVAGQRVTARFDPERLHDPVHVYAQGGAFIATVPLWGATGFLDMAAAKQRQRFERDWRKKAKAATDALDLLSADALVAQLPDYEGDEPVPRPTVVRPVRHRGNTAAALKRHPEAAQPPLSVPQEAPIDRFTRAVERRLKLVE